MYKFSIRMACANGRADDGHKFDSTDDHAASGARQDGKPVWRRRKPKQASPANQLSSALAGDSGFDQ